MACISPSDQIYERLSELIPANSSVGYLGVTIRSEENQETNLPNRRELDLAYRDRAHQQWCLWWSYNASGSGCLSVFTGTPLTLQVEGQPFFFLRV